MKVWLLGAFVLFAASAVAADGGHKHDGGPRDGRYLGVAVFDSLGWKMPCVLDLTVVQDGPDAQYERRRAFLKCLPGGFASRESLTEYYDQVPYSFEKQTLQLIDSHADLKASLTVKGETLVGDIRSVRGRVQGKLTLQVLVGDDEEPDPEEPGADDAIQGAFGDGGSKLPFFPAMSGDWAGKCDGQEWRLHMQSAMSGHEIAIGGAIARFNDPCSFDGQADWCWIAGFPRTQWNPFQASGRNLHLYGPRNSLNCRVTATGADCDRLGALTQACQFVRTPMKAPEATFYRRQNHAELQAEQRVALPDVPKPADLEGRFWGLLHHELLDRYQWVELSVESFYDTDNPHRGYETLKVAADATLYFGANPTGDRVVARFDARPYQNTFPDFTFSGPGEAMFRVIDWKKGTLRGVWYEKGFGRVGTVELVRAEKAPAVADVKFVPALTGNFRGPRFAFTLQTQPLGAGMLDIQGSTLSLQESEIAGPPILSGTYDWRTGGIALVTDLYTVTGVVEENGAFTLDWPVNPAAGGFIHMPEVKPTPYLREAGK